MRREVPLKVTIALILGGSSLINHAQINESKYEPGPTIAAKMNVFFTDVMKISSSRKSVI